MLGELTGDQEIKLLITWNAIQNRQDMRLVYEAHLQDIAYQDLSDVGYDTTHHDLDRAHLEPGYIHAAAGI